MKVLKSYGTSGAVVMSPGAGDPEIFDRERPVFINFDGLPVPFFIESIEEKGNKFIVKLEGIDNLECAEEISGRIVSFSLDEDCPEDDEPFVGMTVFDSKKREIGKVTAFNNYNGNTCIDVEYNGKEITLPVNEELIIKVKGDKLFLVIPEGLL